MSISRKLVLFLRDEADQIEAIFVGIECHQLLHHLACCLDCTKKKQKYYILCPISAYIVQILNIQLGSYSIEKRQMLSWLSFDIDSKLLSKFIRLQS
jgi:hypothetical protein